MLSFFTSVQNMVIDRSTDELIGALMVALGLSLTMTGIYALGRRKVSDASVLMSVLMLLANAASMALAAGYVFHAERGGVVVAQRGASQPMAWQPTPYGPHHGPYAGPRGLWTYPSGFHREGPPPPQIFEAADTDHDGRLTPEEAALFVEKADTKGEGSVDRKDFAIALGHRIPPPPGASIPSSPPLPNPDEMK